MVAMQHYAQVTEADLKDAAKLMVMNDAEKAVHNPVQNPAVSACTESHESLDPIDVTPCQCGANQENASVCDNMQNPQNWALQDSNL